MSLRTPGPADALPAKAGLGWACRVVIALLLMALSALAAAQQRLHDAQRRIGNGPEQAVRLPDWPEATSGPVPAARVQWRVLIDPLPAGCPCAALFPGLMAQARISFNGHLLHVSPAEGSSALPRGLDRIVLVPLPQDLALPTGNRLDIDARPMARMSLSLVEIGPIGALTDRHRARQFALVIGPAVVAAFVATLGLCMGWLWLRRREPVFVLFAGAALAWSLHTLMPLSPWPSIGGMPSVIAWDWLNTVFITLTAAFSLRLAGWRWPMLERSLTAAALGAPVLLAAALAVGVYDEASTVWRLALLLAVALAVAGVARAAWRWRNRASLAVAVSGAVALAFGVHDWLIDLDLDENNPLMLVPYAALLFAATVVTVLIDRFVTVSRHSEALTHELEARVAEQGRQLRDSVAQMRLARDEARTADRAKSSFLAAASHDLRQPAYALGLYLAALPTDGLRAEQAEVLARMREALAALERMFDALLDVSRIDAGAVVPRLQGFHVAGLLHRLASEYAPQAEARGLRLALRLDVGSSDFMAHSDPLLVERILRNLLSNAMKYTRQGGVLLAARLRGAGLDRRCRIEVWDSGLGITMHEQQRVFDEFYQGPTGEGGAVVRSEGLGLGLAIVRRLARLLDLPLTLMSRPGRGTVFLLSLPRGQVSAGVALAPSARDLPMLAGLRLGLIEDDDAVRAALATLLRRWGCQVCSAADAQALLHAPGGEALALDALVVDYALRAGRTGPEEARVVNQALGRVLPVLVVTGEQAPERLRALAELGLPWLPKPVSADALHAALGALRPLNKPGPTTLADGDPR